MGGVIAGGDSTRTQAWSLSASVKQSEDCVLSSVLKGFWEIENNINLTSPISAEDEFCEHHFSKTTVRLPSGAYSVQLPKIDGGDAFSLGDSYQCVLQRFKSLEKKIDKNPEIKAQYSAFMSEYLFLDYMSFISLQSDHREYFLLHHCIHKLDSTTTKLRVVFDGSAKSSTSLSLKDIFHLGPTIQPKLFNTL